MLTKDGTVTTYEAEAQKVLEIFENLDVSEQFALHRRIRDEVLPHGPFTHEQFIAIFGSVEPSRGDLSEEELAARLAYNVACEAHENAYRVLKEAEARADKEGLKLQTLTNKPRQDEDVVLRTFSPAFREADEAYAAAVRAEMDARQTMHLRANDLEAAMIEADRTASAPTQERPADPPSRRGIFRFGRRG